MAPLDRKRGCVLLGGAAPAAHAGLRAALFVEQFGELFEHDATQLLGVDDRDGAAMITRHVVADADRGQFDRRRRPLDDVPEIVEPPRVGRFAGGDPALT
jgi:hypothetical protein